DGDVRVVFSIVEGRQIKIDRIVFKGNKGLTERELKDALATRERQYFILRGKVQRQRLDEDVERIIQLYNDHGYIQARVESTDVVVDREKALVTVTFTVVEGPQFKVGAVKLSGITLLPESEVRRQLKLKTGDVAPRSKLRASLTATERPTGIFSLGGGFSSVDSFVGTIDLAQRNFLGRGLEVSVRLRGGGKTQQGVIGVTDPWLFDRPLSGGFDLYSNTRIFTEYRYETLGAGLRLGHPFFEYWRWSLGYRASQDRISDLSDVAALSTALLQARGTHVTSAMLGSVGRDSRDNVIAPTKGGQGALAAQFAGLGGTERYVKTSAFI